MENARTQPETNVGTMRKQRVQMADGRRYLIYYTFKKEQQGGLSPDAEAQAIGDTATNPQSEIRNPQSVKEGENV